MGTTAFIEYLRSVKKRSPSTLRQYKSILREFQRFEPVTESSFRRYLEHISSNAPKTQRLKLTVVREYLDWKADRGEIRAERRFWHEAEAPRAKSLPHYLERHEVEALLEAVDDPYWRALFRLLVNTGLRISELLSLTEKDISISAGLARIRVRGKGNKERVIVTSSDVVLDAMREGVFSKKVSARTIQRRLKAYAEKAGIQKKITPHTLRHTFAILLLESGVPVNTIQASLGHESLSTTGIYLKIASDSIRLPKVV